MKLKRLINLLLGIFTAFLILILFLWLMKAILSADRKAIEPVSPQQAMVSLPDESEQGVGEESGGEDANLDQVFSSINRASLYYRPEDMKPVYSYLFSGEGLQIASAADRKLIGNENALKAFRDMLSDFYAETGLRTIIITRIYDKPNEGYYNEQGEYVYSDADAEDYEHESGLAIDIALYEDSGVIADFDGGGEYAWFAAHAAEYGFISGCPLGADESSQERNPAHFRYVGKAYFD